MKKKQKVFLISLGCPRNLVDSEILAASSIMDGNYEITFDPYEADFIVINTCGFLESSIKEAKDVIEEYLELKKTNPQLKIIVSGCMAERFGRDKKIFKDVDLIRGIDHYDVPKQFYDERKRFIFGEKNNQYPGAERLLLTGAHYEYLKIAEGCSHKCTYCLIPHIKGPLRSRSINDILEEAGKLLKQGISELIIIAQDTTDYGKDLFGGSRLLELLEELDKMGFTWIRVHYLNPADIGPAWVERFLKMKTSIPYFDIPIQHVSERILRFMGRPSLNKGFYDSLPLIRSAGGILRTNLIIGFPGESEDDFKELADFLRKTRVERAVFFPFSDENNITDSLSLQPVQLDKIEKRISLLEEIQTENIYETFPVGKKEIVVIDREAKGGYEGRTFRDSPGVDLNIKVTGKQMTPGKFIKAKLYIQDGEFRGRT